MTDVAIRVNNISKCFQIYDIPRDMAKQLFMPTLQRVVGEEVKQYYREFWALKDISFEIKKGETVGIIGRNGSGKSTLLQLICGTLSPTNGIVETRGRIAALLELGSGFNPLFTGRENVYMNAAVLGLTKKEVDERFDDIVAFADIGDFIEQPIKSYSSGMVVRLAFSVAINVNPEILIVDEALSVGDELFQRKCFSKIEELKKNGATILFVSHSVATIVQLCDRAILLDKGERLAEGNSKLIVDQYQKLIYAPNDRRTQVRSQILEMQLGLTNEIKLNDKYETNNSHLKSFKNIAEDFDSSYDANLISLSKLEYESLGAQILSPQIQRITGENVNNLTSGETYHFKYVVNFVSSARNVQFAMLIKTTSGIQLGGAITDGYSQGIPLVSGGETIEIGFTFDCNLNSDIYYINAGVVGDVDGMSQAILHRIVDAAVFRVLPVENATSTAIVNFNCNSSIKIIQNPLL